MGTAIRALVREDWESVRSVYLGGIATGQATFETELPTWADLSKSHFPAPRLVATSDGHLAGWAAVSPVSARAVYSGVAEVSVCVAEDMRGKGIGLLLFQSLVKESEQNGIWTLQASIFSENAASISLHKSCGFREVGTRERIASMKGIWRHTALFERRSELAGAGLV